MKIFELIAVLIVLVSIPRPLKSEIVLFDDTFDQSEWDEQIFVVSGGAAFTTNQVLVGGNSGAFRRMTHSLPGPSSIGVFHRYLPATYNPSVSGEIQSLDYSEDRIQINPPFGGAIIGASAALEQDGVVYLGPDIEFTSLSWQTIEMMDLNASHFSSNGNNPDFTNTGGIIHFGFTRSNTRNGSAPLVTTEHGIDNWSFTINTVPEPSSLSLLGLVVLPLVSRRRT